MKKTLFTMVIVFFVICSCRKQVLQTNDIKSSNTEVTSTASSPATPFSFQNIYDASGTFPNPCTNELMDFSGTIHLEIRGVFKDGRFAYKFHVNTSNAKAIGQTTGTVYVALENYEYQNIDNYSPQAVYSQVHPIRYVAPGGGNNFTVENSWHLTVNANGEETVYFNTFDVITCQ